MVQLGAFTLRPPDLWTTQLRAFFDVPDDGVFHLCAVGLKQIPVAELKEPGAPDFEGLICIGEIWHRLFAGTTERREDPALLVNDRGHPGVHRQTTDIRTPGNTHASKVALQRTGEYVSWLTNGDRRPRIRSGENAQQQGGILDCAGHRSFDRQRTPADTVRPDRDPTRRRAQPHYVAKTRRVAQ